MSFFDDGDEDETYGNLHADQTSNIGGHDSRAGGPVAGPSRQRRAFDDDGADDGASEWARRAVNGSDRASSVVGGRGGPRTNGAGSSVTGRAVYDTSTRAGSVGLDEILGDNDDDFGFGGQRERLIERLIRAWNNEIGAPELLKFPKRLIERTVKDLARRVSWHIWVHKLLRCGGLSPPLFQKALVKEANATENAEDSLYMQANIVAIENMRIAHVLKSLLRERIYKVRLTILPHSQSPTQQCRWLHRSNNMPTTTCHKMTWRTGCITTRLHTQKGGTSQKRPVRVAHSLTTGFTDIHNWSGHTSIPPRWNQCRTKSLECLRRVSGSRT